MRIFALLALFGWVAFAAKAPLADVLSICHSLPPALWCSCRTLTETCGHTADCAKYSHYAYNEPLHLTVFYESLCPDCQRFVIEELYTALYTTPLRKLVRIELIPYGNARQLANGTIVCQHGEQECAINKFESCALHYIKEPIPFIACLEGKLFEGADLEDASRECYKKQHTVPHVYDQITHCVNDDLGLQLQATAAKRTASAWPDTHTHVPWVLFNNVSVANKQFLITDLPLTVCQLYTGDDNQAHCVGIGAANDRRLSGAAAGRRAGCAREFF